MSPTTAPAAIPSPPETKLEISQPQTSPTIANQPQLDAKDRRAFEVARQRAKRPEDRRKARKQKAKHGWLAGMTRPRVSHAVAEDATVVADAATCEAKTKTQGSQEAGWKPEGNANANEGVRGATVRLEDLIRVAKIRKEKAGDFELIPHVRAVVALDDATFGEDGVAAKIPDFDFHDWEHVESSSGTSSGEEEEPRKALSYAQVVSNVKA